MYKLVAVDLDGTLLNSYGEISNETKKGIKEVVLTGIHLASYGKKELNLY